MNFKLLFELGISGGVGFFIGLGAVAWLEPTTSGGIYLTFVISIAACVTIGRMFSAAKKAKRSAENKISPPDQPEK